MVVSLFLRCFYLFAQLALQAEEDQNAEEREKVVDDCLLMRVPFGPNLVHSWAAGPDFRSSGERTCMD